MMRSMFAGVTGLRNHQLRLDVIGANIANVNTTGYKRSRVTFQDALYQQIRGASRPQDNRGGTNSMQVGLGMNVATVDIIHTGGSSQPTDKITDLCIQGEGFFITNDGGRNVYTRAGTFDFDVSGNYYNTANGQRVMGYMADVATGQINYSTLVPIDISGHRSVPPKATGKVELTGNVDLGHPVDQLPKSITKTVFDSLGAEHELKFDFDKDNVNLTGNLDRNNPPVGPVDVVVKGSDGSSSETVQLKFTPIGDPSGSQWDVTISYPDTTTENITIDFNNLERFNISVPVGTTPENVNVWIDPTKLTQTISAGTSDVTGSDHQGPGVWNITTYFDGVAPAAPTSPTLIQFDSKGQIIDPLNITVQATGLANKADDMNIVVDLSQLTQYEAEWTAWPETQDGYGSGDLRSFTIDVTGTIMGSYSNGETKALGQVALATFQNPAGLLPLGQNQFDESANSGPPDIGEPGVKARGTIIPGSLEMSNVDLSQEFTDMITTQRGFQANSRIITASDEMLQELVNLKR
jgi:flagellar hook protein FlgE